MKKAVSTLIALALVLCMGAFALQGSGYPSRDAGVPAENSISGNFGGASLAMEFDPSAEYSMLRDGMIQACFFAYDQSETSYIEIYLELPSNVQSGDRLSTAEDMRGISSSAAISFYEVSADSETLYYAGSVIGIPYPDASLFEINIAEAVHGADSIELSGTLSATLVRFDANNQPLQENMQLTDVSFHFRLPVSDSGESAPAPQIPDAAPPKATAPASHPLFTLPPDHISL